MQMFLVPILVSEKHKLLSLNITALEVKSVLEKIPMGKAIGPGGINNRILRELANELADPLSLFYNFRFKIAKFQTTGKKHTSVRFTRVVILY